MLMRNACQKSQSEDTKNKTCHEGVCVNISTKVLTKHEWTDKSWDSKSNLIATRPECTYTPISSQFKQLIIMKVMFRRHFTLFHNDRASTISLRTKELLHLKRYTIFINKNKDANFSFWSSISKSSFHWHVMQIFQ